MTVFSFRGHAGRRAGLLFLVVILSLASCSPYIGYALVNWSVPEMDLVAGDIVPVYIQSNISRVYVIGTGEGGKNRAEVPLWQLTLYKSKSAARAASRLQADYRFTYASVKIDGLPVRAAPDNTSRQVYRLRQGEKIKIVRKGEGSPVIAGNAPLEGDWFEVMTDDGTKGWCFSYNLALFDERERDSGLDTLVDAGPDELLQSLLSRPWYPDAYRTMIAESRVDITRINPAWGFFPGRDTGVARIENEEGVISFPYTTVSRGDSGVYRFEGSSLTVQVRRRDLIMVQYTDKNGMPQAVFYSSLDTGPDELIRIENGRRSAVIDRIRDAGPSFASGNYGLLRILDDGQFLWSGYQLLSPSVIPAAAGGSGTIETRLFLANNLADLYDGALSFRFENTTRWITFLYALDERGLRLENVSDTFIRDSVIQSRNLNPTVIFFTPETSGPGGM